MVRRARTRLESMKAERESLQNARQQEIYEKLPRVRQIDKQLRSSMVLAVQASFLRGEDSTQALEQVKQRAKSNVNFENAIELLLLYMKEV